MRDKPLGCGRAAVNEELIPEALFLAGGNGPVAQSRNIRIDESLLVNAPGRRMIWVFGMIKDGNAKDPVAKGLLHGAPGGALLFPVAAAQRAPG